jgi:hypothetical protein
LLVGHLGCVVSTSLALDGHQEAVQIFCIGIYSDCPVECQHRKIEPVLTELKFSQAECGVMSLPKEFRPKW